MFEIPRKYLLVTSDDFGMCHAVNAGIVRGMREGVITATTLMAPCPWFPEAVALAKKYRLPAGVHLCLTCEWDRMRWSPLTHAPSLTSADGFFLTNYPALVEAARDEEIVRELEAQIARVKATGLEPTHVDVHMLAGDDARPGLDRFKDHIRQIAKKHDLVWFRDYHPKEGLLHLTGQIGSSSLPEKAIWQALEGWDKPGFYHIIAHAAEDMPELDAICSEDHSNRAWAAEYRLADMRFLADPSTRGRIGKLGFELIDVPAFLRLKKLDAGF